jgi:glycosyltransferase involved in cell wall biosynthesis
MLKIPERVSVAAVVATFNSAPTIQQCLSSLIPYMKLGFLNEIVVVDGGSTDETVQIVKTFPAKLIFENVRSSYSVSPIKSHYGKYVALNQGWRITDSDFVMFLDSDAYIGDGLFPHVLRFFANPAVGVVGCWPKPWGASGISSIVGHLWQYHGKMLNRLQTNKGGWLQRLYESVVTFGNNQVLVSGPCYIVRRGCLEEINGHDIVGDVGLSLRLHKRGWSSLWWVDSPVYHKPKQDLISWRQQRFFWGRVGAYMPHNPARFYLSELLRIAGSVALGLVFTLQVRNRTFLTTLPQLELFYLAGYLKGVSDRTRPHVRH